MASRDTSRTVTEPVLNRESIRSILIINLGGIGDALLSTPALRAIRKAYPDSVMSVLTSRGASEVFGSLPYVSDVNTLRLRYGGRLSLGELFGNMRILLGLRNRKFDLAVNMRTIYSRSGAANIRMLLGIVSPKLTAGRNTEGRGEFFDIKIPETAVAEKYERDYDIELAARLGAEADDTRLELVITDEDRAAARAVIESARLPRGILVGLHPGGKPSRRLPPECFAAVATILRRKLGCELVITGDESEMALADRIIRMSGIAMVNAAGTMTVGATGALIERCSVYISNDTANMHIAAALGTPLVAIFGPGDLTRFDPRRSSAKATVIYHKAPCAPCEDMNCDRLECLKPVSANEVAQAALALLGRPDNSAEAER